MTPLLAPGDGALLWMRLSEHIVLTFASTALACVIGVGLSLLAFRFQGWRRPLLTLVHAIQTVPSMALLVLLLAVFQRIGALPAMIALTLYALLPIVQGTLLGLESASPALVEASRGMGLTRGERLLHLHLPLALPSIVASIRVAATIGVGVATIAAFIGAGGLGQFINRGLFLNDTRLILLGAVPAALLALGLDAMIAGIERAWFSRRAETARHHRSWRRIVFTSLPLIVFTLAFFGEGSAPSAENRIVVGSKNFTEQLILGEIAAQLIEHDTGLPVERRFGLGGSPVLHRALQDGEIDLYPEYSGTALSAILKIDHLPRDQVFPTMRREYAARYGLDVLPPLGFDNRYVLLMEKSRAEAAGIARLSDLREKAAGLRAGVDFEFAERADGLKGLAEREGIRFASVSDMDPAILYAVLAKKQVDLISGYATDGRIDQYQCISLTDDLDFFPPYQAAFVLRQKIAKNHPEVQKALEKLSGRIDDATMRRLNGQADFQHESPKELAAAFLRQAGLAPP